MPLPLAVRRALILRCHSPLRRTLLRKSRHLRLVVGEPCVSCSGNTHPCRSPLLDGHPESIRCSEAHLSGVRNPKPYLQCPLHKVQLQHRLWPLGLKLAIRPVSSV